MSSSFYLIFSCCPCPSLISADVDRIRVLIRQSICVDFEIVDPSLLHYAYVSLVVVDSHIVHAVKKWRKEESMSAQSGSDRLMIPPIFFSSSCSLLSPP